jgi:hypothetical protein
LLLTRTGKIIRSGQFFVSHSVHWADGALHHPCCFAPHPLKEAIKDCRAFRCSNLFFFRERTRVSCQQSHFLKTYVLVHQYIYIYISYLLVFLLATRVLRRTMDSPASPVCRSWHSAAPRPICNFFAMGGCNKGDHCPFSHELVQVAPKGVDVSNGFYISGKVANYKAAAAAAATAVVVTASSSSPDSGRKSDEAGNASSADGLSNLASPSSHSVTGASLTTETREVADGDTGSTVAVVSWSTSATTSSSSVKSQRTVTASPTYSTTSMLSQAPSPCVPPQRAASPQQPSSQQSTPPQLQPQPAARQPTPLPAPQPTPQPAQPLVQYNRPAHQPPFQQQQQQQQPPAPLPPQPRSVANARQAIARNTESPALLNRYTAPQRSAQTTQQQQQQQQVPPAATVGKYSSFQPVIQGTASRSAASSSSLPAGSPALFSPLTHPVPSVASSAPSSTGGLRKDWDAVPAITPTAPPRYTASSTAIATPTTTTPTSTIGGCTFVPHGRFSSTALPELLLGMGTLATRNEPPTRVVETPLPRSREVHAAAGEATNAAPHRFPSTSAASAAVTTPAAAPPQYEAKAAAMASTSNGQTRVMPPAPRSQQQHQQQAQAQAQQQEQQQQQQQQTQLRAQFQTQQQLPQPQLQPFPSSAQHQHTPHDVRLQQQHSSQLHFHHSQQQQQYHVPSSQAHVPSSPLPPPPPPPPVQQLQLHPQPHPQPQQQQYQYQPQPPQQQAVFIMSQPRSTATGTPPCESPAAAPQLPCGYSLAYALPASTSAATQLIISEQPNEPRPTYTVLAPSSPHAPQPQLQQGFAPSKNAVLYLGQTSLAAPHSSAAPLDNSVPRFILVKADGTFTVLQTAF